MAEDRVDRRLAAILAGDVAGYSRLMGADEEATLRQLKAHRKELVDPKIAEHRGRIVKTTGDGMLVEFVSVVDAVRCAVDIQRGMIDRNAEVPLDRRIEFRMGINVGDIISDANDIYGDGVNVAARLEGLAKPGGILVSRNVFDQVRDKLSFAFEDLGEQTVKNIARPIGIHRVELDAVGATIVDRPASAMPAADFPGSSRPALAVLPFTNLGGEAEQEYFADGIAEDIITALSRFRWFHVVARNSSFTYKGRAIDVRTVGRELGVRYVLEGSVRKGGNRLRITAQLIDAASGNHLWAEKYDGALEDVFDLQDRITEGVAGAIEPSIRRAEIERARRKRPDSLDAYDFYLRALPHASVWSAAEAATAIELLDSALSIDPRFVAARGLAAWCNNVFAVLDPGDPRRHTCLEHAHAVLDPNTDDSLALAFAGFAVALHERNHDSALDAVNRALAFTPNSPIVLALSAQVNAFVGNFDDAIRQAQASLRLSPFDPMRFIAEIAAAYGYFFTERHEEAAAAAQRAININPGFVPALALVVASLTRAGKKEAAGAATGHLLKVKPNFQIGEFIRVGRFTAELNEKFAAALRDSQLPG
ncbi:MAG TPA: adenylate/guanylate cyclase domain-containing protein [Alphaproteobacteria bacterium]